MAGQTSSFLGQSRTQYLVAGSDGSLPSNVTLGAAQLTGVLSNAQMPGNFFIVPARAKVLHIAPGRLNGAAGTGAIENPLDGGSSAKLQAILSTAPSGSVVSLLPGNYAVQSRPSQPWSCALLQGAGRDVTTLTLEVQDHGDYHTPFYPGNNPRSLTVTDLTFDLQAQLQPRGSVLVCGLASYQGGFERVRVVNWGNSPLSLGDGGIVPNICREAFGLVVSPVTATARCNVFIRNCVVEAAIPNVTGGGNTCMGINGMLTGLPGIFPVSGSITGNVINARPGDFGIALAGYAQGVIVDGNHVLGAGRAFHYDTTFYDSTGAPGYCGNISVTNNAFEDCFPLMGLGSGGGGARIDGVKFDNNICTVGIGNYGQYGGGCCFWLDKNVTNVTVSNNQIGIVPGVTIPLVDGRVFAYLSGNNGLFKLADNTVQARLVQYPAYQIADDPGTASPTILRPYHNYTRAGASIGAPFINLS